MHLQPIFKNCKVFDNAVSEDLFCRGLCLPSGSNMNDFDLDRVIDNIKTLYES